MNCNIPKPPKPPKPWERLPQRDKDIISQVYTDLLNEQLDKDIQVVQEVMIKLGCTILNEMGLTEEELLQYVALWRKAYRRIAREQLRQTEWLDEQMARCFPTHGFPQDRIDNMKD